MRVFVREMQQNHVTKSHFLFLSDQVYSMQNDATDNWVDVAGP